MPYINFSRRHNEEARLREEARNDAERVDNLRGPFVDWARKNGKSEDEIRQGLQQLDEVVMNRRRHASRES